MGSWILVGEENFFSAAQVIVAQGRRIALFRVPQGIFAIDDTCSHAEASLAEGEVSGFEVECAKHGARFDIRTGQHLCFPAVRPVKSYKTKTEDGKVYIEIE